MTAKTRIPELDLIRTVAIFLVILQHSWSMLGLDTPAAGASYGAYSSIIYGVPLFLMLSGFFQLGHSFDSPRTYLGKRFSRILVPFLFWGAVVYAISAAAHRYEVLGSFRDGLVQFLPYLLTNRINPAYWYIFILSGLYLLTPLLQEAFLPAAERRRPLTYALMLWVCITALGDVFPGFALLGYFPVAGRYLGYYLLGFYVCSFVRDRRFCLRTGAIGLAAAYAANVLMTGAGRPLLTLELVEVLCIFLLLKSFKVGEGPASRLTAAVSRYSYTIYLTHFIIIGALYNYLPWLFPVHWATPLYTAPLVLAAGCLFCLVLDKVGSIPKRLVGLF